MEKEKFDYYIKTEKNNWEVIIGLEVHAQVFLNQNFFLVHQLNLEQNQIHKLAWLTRDFRECFLL